MVNQTKQPNIDLAQEDTENILAIAVIYDKECPICHQFAACIDKSNPHIQIINGREKSKLLEKADRMGLDIDQGSIVHFGKRFYFGSEALWFIANHSKAQGLIGLANKILFRHRMIAKWLYPFLVLSRRILLRLRAKPLIKEKATASSQALKIYYNSACPVCNAGIKYQKRCMDGLDIRWQDIHCDIKAADEINSDLEFIRKRLHAVDSAGNVYVGIDAFVKIWAISPGEAWKAHFFSLPIIHSIAAISYNIFAWLLYRWNIVLKHW